MRTSGNVSVAELNHVQYIPFAPPLTAIPSYDLIVHHERPRRYCGSSVSPSILPLVPND